MKYSLKRQFAVTFITLMACTILLCWLLNTTLLESYYINNKQGVLLKAYQHINAASNEGNTNTDEFKMEVQKICGIYNISLLIINADSEPVTSSVHETNILVRELMDHIFGFSDEENEATQESGAEPFDREADETASDEEKKDKNNDGKSQEKENGEQRKNFFDNNRTKILSQTENYTIQNIMDPRTGSRYIEMWGFLDNGNPFIIRCMLEGIRDSAEIANRFLAYIGIVAITLSAIISSVLARRMTKPIMQLADVSKKMTNLDFEAKYTGDDKNEIGILGNHMNQMSDTLERTISELKTANNELKNDIQKKEEIDEMRKEFLSNVSHELKTPIALIMGYAEGLKLDVNEDVESREFYCDVIMDEAQKMDVLVKKLLTLNQLEFGNDIVTMERFDVVEMIHNYLNSTEILVQQNEATVIFEESEPVFVWGDEFKIEEVLMNYFTNALHYAEGEKRIEISVIKQDGKARVSVFNTGKQIPEESIDHLWEKFYKVDKARTREYGGSGVGLSIVKAIMESMNQGYGVSNRENGVEFWFELECK